MRAKATLPPQLPPGPRGVAQGGRVPSFGPPWSPGALPCLLRPRAWHATVGQHQALRQGPGTPLWSWGSSSCENKHHLRARWAASSQASLSPCGPGEGDLLSASRGTEGHATTPARLSAGLCVGKPPDTCKGRG